MSEIGPPSEPAGRARAAAGIRLWAHERARDTGHQVVRLAPVAIAASLVAAAVTPLVGAEAGLVGGGLMTAFMAYLGNVGGQATADALEHVMGRLHRQQAAVTEPEVRDALAQELLDRLGQPGADGLRAEMAEILRSVNGVEIALTAAFDAGSRQLQEQLASALVVLSTTYLEFAGFSEVVLAALDSLRRDVTELLQRERLRSGMDQQILLEQILMRRLVAELLAKRELSIAGPPEAAALGPGQPASYAIPGRDAPTPYRGLAAFQVHDAQWFHGREELTATLVSRLAERLPGPSVLVVVGASGAGKSSLLNAGLVPALRSGALAVPGSDTWPYVPMTPGSAPVRELAIHLAMLAQVSSGSIEADLRADPSRFSAIARQAAVAWIERLTGGAGAAPGRLVLVVDQFEELFTQCRDEAERQEFVHALCAAARGGAGLEPPPALIVLGLRADFYAECTAYPDLVGLLEGSQVVVGAMSAVELRRAIERPAESAGLALEAGLVDVIVRDLDTRLVTGERPGYDPGRLPLLSHALLETWQRRRDGVLDIAGYQAAGGINQAVSMTADRLYEGLGREERAMVRQLLLRLVVVSETALEDTRGRLSRAELLRERAPEARRAIESALDALVGARLVTATEDTFEITHEALLRVWPRLRAWIEEDREWLTIRRQLSEAADSWERASRDPGELYGRARLARVRDQMDDGRRAELDHRELAFLAASGAQEARRERAARWRLRGLTAIAGVLTILLAVTGALAIFASGQSAAADEQRRIADSRQVAFEADALRATDPAVSALLSVQAYRIAQTTEARSSVISTQAPYYTALPAGPLGRVNAVAFSPNGALLAAAGQQGSIELWDVPGHQLRPIIRDPGNAGAVLSVAFSPDGATLAAAGVNGTVELWDVARPRLLAVLADGWGAVNAVGFDPVSGLLAAGGNDGALRLWDPGTRRLLGSLAPPGGPTGTIAAVAFSSDGRTIATGGGDGTVLVWDVASRHPVVLGGQALPVRAVAFSSDGMLASGGDDGSVRLWGPAQGVSGRVLGGSTDMIDAVAFSPDGRTLAAGSDKGVLQLFDVRSRATPVSLAGPTAAVRGLAFAPDGTLAGAEANATIGLWSIGGSSVLAPGPAPKAASSVAVGPRGQGLMVSANPDGAVRLWRTDTRGPAGSIPVPPGTPGGLGGGVLGVALSPDRRTAAAATPGGDVVLWDLEAQKSIGILSGDGGSIDAVAFSHSGALLATAGADAKVRFWDVRTQKAYPGEVQDHLGTINALVFSRDDRMIASAGDDGTIVLSQAPTGAYVRTYTGHLAAVEAVAFSPDGRTLASGGADDKVDLWNSDGTAIATMSGHTGPVTSVAFSPDGTTLASAADDHTVQLWRLSDASLLATVSRQVDVPAVAFSPDGRALAGADRQGQAIFWDTDAGRVVSRICAGHPSLTASQWRQYLPPDQPYQPTCP